MPDPRDKFRHTTKHIETGNVGGYETPLWVVGNSPFDPFPSKDEGHIVHLGEPEFVARWFVGDSPRNPTDRTSGIAYHDAERDITVCEVVISGKQRSAFEAWLYEATAIIAAWRDQRPTSQDDG